MSTEAQASVPAEDQVTRCRDCQALIFFARTDAARNMPLDARPVTMFEVPPLRPGERQHSCKTVRVYRPHWEKCPGAEKRRKER